MRNRNHGGSEKLSEVWKNWRCSLKNMCFYLSWRNPCKILKVPYPSSRKENSFSLFSPKFSCHTKRRIYWKGFTLSLLWSSISGLHLFRHTAHPGKARHERHIRTALGSLFFCLFHPLSLSYFHLGALLICFYAHLAFILLDNIKTLRHSTPPSFLLVARIYHTK